MINNVIIAVFFLSLCNSNSELEDWGFFAHQKINETAVFTLPPEMIGFYKHHIHQLKENAVKPDMRRYINPDEAPRHYIDLDVYGDSALFDLPKYWLDAVEKYSEDTLKAYGIVPWHIEKVKYFLTKAFMNKDARQILRLSADIGHYIGDANVPLHTTENYNGQLTDQRGIHGFWESRLPELFFDEYNLFTGRAEYISDTQGCIWDAIARANGHVETVLNAERELSLTDLSGIKHSVERRGKRFVNVYSYRFSKEYHKMLNGMVESQLRHAIKMTGDFWYTSWVDAGQPDISELILDDKKEDEQIRKIDSIKVRNHESGK